MDGVHVAGATAVINGANQVSLPKRTHPTTTRANQHQTTVGAQASVRADRGVLAAFKR